MPKTAKTKAFVKPTVEQVETFMNIKKPEWPAIFTRHLAEKFWNHYQSNGWKISGRAAMKDYKAAICAQWLDLKYKEDRDYLETCLKSVTHRIEMDRRTRESAGMFADQDTVGKISPFERMLERIEALRNAWKNGMAKQEAMCDAWSFLKDKSLLQLSAAQENYCAMKSGNDGNYRKVLEVAAFFTILDRKGLSVKDYIHSRLQKAQ